MGVKLISLWPPWAHAIACVHEGVPLKSVETRGWKTAYRGPLLIHATGRWDGEMRAFWTSLAGQVQEKIGVRHPLSRLYARPPAVGQVVAACDLSLCRPMVNPASGKFYPWVEQLSGVERLFGDYAPGRYGFTLTNLRPLPRPVPFKSRQGKLLDAPPDLVAQVKEQLGGTF